MHQSFYQFLLTHRGKLQQDDYSKLADWAFYDHHFPQYANNYDEISDYLEWNSPFPEALKAFDELWTEYEWKYSS
ncbi:MULTISPECIES: YozE family protein [Oceanobacillus]|uniref:YozE family protein n=1 Tax=Oceanobacillus TaxID=182709 RepID=UPI0030D7D652